MARHVLLLIGVCTLTFFVGLGRPAISDSDEGFYAESAREMIERGDWLTPHFNYVYRFEKPILYYWAAAGAYLAFGVNETAARFPSALAGLGLSLLVFLIGRRWYDSTTGLLAGLLTATSFGHVTMARQALPDLMLAFFVTLTTWSALNAWLSPPSHRPVMSDAERRRWVICAAIAAAAGVLAKGPVGLVLPAIVVVPLVAWEYAVERSARLRVGDVVLAGVAFIVLVAPWFVQMVAVHGLAYLDRFFVTENLDRFATSRYNDPRPWWYYMPIVVGGMLPWSPYMMLWLRPVWAFVRGGSPADATTIRLVWWALAPLLFYTASVGKQPRYVLPMLGPLALLLGATLRERLRRRTSADRPFELCTMAAGAGLIVIGILIFRARALFVDWSLGTMASLAIAVALSGLGVGLAGLARRFVVAALTFAAVVATLGAHYIVLSSAGPSPVERIATMIGDARHDDEPYGRHAVFNRNLVFYMKEAFIELPALQAADELLREPTRVLVVLRSADANKLAARGVPLVRLGDVTYLNTGSLNLRTLIDPSPARLERVVLVSNR